MGGVDIPILLLVDDDLDQRAVAESQLRSRYGTDYQVLCAGSGDDPVRLLAELRDGQRQVSVVLAAQSMRGQSMGGMTGTGLLAQVRQFHPAAKCLLLTDWGYGPARRRSCGRSNWASSMTT